MFDGVLILKVLTAVDLPALQEGILMCNLRGGCQLVNLSEISLMEDEERRHDDVLKDLKTLLEDPKTFKIVEGVGDLVRLGERIHQSLNPTDFLALDSWHEELRTGFLPTVRVEFPNRYESLTLPFRGERHPGWKWEFQQDPETLCDEQLRLIYALASSLISMSLDGIVGRLFGRSQEKRPPSELGKIVADVTEEEVLLFMEARQLEAVVLNEEESSDQPIPKKQSDLSQKKKQRFLILNGVRIAESLPGGYCREVATSHPRDPVYNPPVPIRRHIYDIYVWEESLDYLYIVPAMPYVQDEVWEFGKPTKGCLKKFKEDDILIDKYGGVFDPDVADRGRIRFPDLDTSVRVGNSRAASPPPRPDDPDGLRDENRRRKLGLRPWGPPCRPGIPENKSFIRDLEWEKRLPDDDCLPYVDEEPAKRKTKFETPPGKKFKASAKNEQSRVDTSMSPKIDQLEERNEAPSSNTGASTEQRQAGRSQELESMNWRNDNHGHRNGSEQRGRGQGGGHGYHHYSERGQRGGRGHYPFSGRGRTMFRPGKRWGGRKGYRKW